MKSRITKNIGDHGILAFNYSQLITACLLNEQTIIVADFMDLNLCEAIRAREQDGLEEEEIL